MKPSVERNRITNKRRDDKRKAEREARLLLERGYVKATVEQLKERKIKLQRDRRLAKQTPEQIARKEVKLATQIAKLTPSPPKRRKSLKPRIIKQIKKVAVLPVTVKEDKRMQSALGRALTRNIDLGKCVKVVISPKLIVYVRQGTNVEKTRQKYLRG